MNMQFPKNYRPVGFPSQQMQQGDDALNLMLKQSDKSALIAKLNSGFFSPKTLHSLLYRAFSEEHSDVVAMILKTESYASEVVLATIIVESLNNEQEKVGQGENKQEQFVTALLKDESLKVKVLTKALDIADRKGMNRNNDRPLSERLLKLAVLSADEKKQIAYACPYVSEVLLFEQVNRKNSTALSTNHMVSDKTKVTKKVSQKKMKFAPLKLTERASLSNIAQDNKIGIGHFLPIRDLMRYGQVSRDFNKVMQDALRSRTTCIEISELTESGMLALRKVSCLNLRYCAPTDEVMSRIGQLTNLHALDLCVRGFKATGEHFTSNGITNAGLRHLEKLANLHTLGLNCTQLSDNGLRHLEKLTHLHALNLFKTKLTDNELRHLEKLTHLHTLNLMSTNVTDFGLQHLKKLTGLQTLILDRTKVTDAGLPHLEELTHLHTLDLSHTAVTYAGVKHLEKRLPNLKIRLIGLGYV